MSSSSNPVPSSSNPVPSSSNPLQPKRSTCKDPSLDDIDSGLGGLHSYDLRSLSQPCGATKYEDNNGGEEGDGEEIEVGQSEEDSSEDSDFDEAGEEDDEEGDCVSLMIQI